jgi:hypothetical protein
MDMPNQPRKVRRTIRPSRGNVRVNVVEQQPDANQAGITSVAKKVRNDKFMIKFISTVNLKVL